MINQEYSNVYIEATNAEGFPIKQIPTPGVNPKTGILLSEIPKEDIPEGTVRLQLKQLWGNNAKYTDLSNTTYENVVFIGDTVLPASEVMVRDTRYSSAPQEEAANDFPLIPFSEKHPNSTHVLVFNENVKGKAQENYAALDSTTTAVNKNFEIMYPQ